MTTTSRYSIVATNHCGPKADELVKQMAPGESVILVREPNNPHDRNAVAVWARGLKIGYIPRKNNAALAQFIDQTGTPRGFPIGTAGLAEDGAVSIATTAPERAIEGRFALSTNSAFPQVEI